MIKKKMKFCYKCVKNTPHVHVGTDRFLFVPMYRFWQCERCGYIDKSVAD